MNTKLRDDMMYFWGMLGAISFQIANGEDVSYDILSHMSEQYAYFMKELFGYKDEGHDQAKATNNNCYRFL